MMKLSLQNSRFMKVSHASVKTDKPKVEVNEEEQEKDQSSHIVIDTQSYITCEQVTLYKISVSLS